MRTLLLAFLLLSGAATAQQSEHFGDYEIHYSVVNTTFLQPEIAARYNIVRGDQRAILTLAVRQHSADGAVTKTVLLKGRTWDLIQTDFLEFQEIREGDAVYYIAPFRFINEEWRFFEVDFRPEGSERTEQLKFKKQLYMNP